MEKRRSKILKTKPEDSAKPDGLGKLCVCAYVRIRVCVLMQVCVNARMCACMRMRTFM